MNTKIVAGPLGFHAYCAPEVFAPGILLWEQIHNYIGPQRETQAEAQQDLCAMIAATVAEPPVKETPRLFAKMSDNSIRMLYHNGKARNRGLRPFFRDPHTMIALRKEYDRRFK